MKRYLIILSALLALASCSLLDIVPDGRESLDEIFADPDKTAAFLNTCYREIPEKGNSYYWVCNAPNALSDEGYLVYGTIADPIPAKMYLGSASATTHPLRDAGNYYDTYMFQLRQCTIFLQRIGSANVSETDRARYTAEAHLLRAYFMLELFKWFGVFAYEPDGYPADYNYANLVRRTPWEMARCIDDECTAALAGDALPWRIDNPNETLRVTKALAWCIKSKAYLIAASPLMSEDIVDEGGKTADQIKADHWEEAFQVGQAAVKALESNGYALKTTVSDPARFTGAAAAYQELFTSTSLTTVDDRETIWHAGQKQSFVAHNYIGSYTLPNATRAGVVPTQEMVDAYEVLSADGKKAEPLLVPTKPYLAGKTPNYNPAALALGFDADDPYAAPRDPRMAVTIIKDGDSFFWDDKMVVAQTSLGGDNGLNYETGENRFTRTGYYYRKWVAPDDDAIKNLGAAPWKYFRLAEIKLNLAEAAAEAGHADVARAQCDDIRARVGMPALPATLSGAELVARVHNERMVELCCEEVRYFDVRRWSESFESSPLFEDFHLRCGSLTAMEITLSGGAKTYVRKVNLTNKSTQTRDLLLPIPESEAQVLFSLTGRRWQNTGW